MEKKYCLATLLIIVIAFISVSAFAQGVGINTTSSPPNGDAGLDVNFTNKGVLIPRISLTNTGTYGLTGGGPTLSMLVFNTNASLTGTGAVGTGYYYWNGTRWTKLLSLDNLADAWLTIGNANTNPTNNFLGTTDNVGLALRTNNIERMRITAGGDVGIGTNSPTEQLHVFENNDANKSTIFAYARQISTGTDYQNRAIVGQARGGSGTWGYSIGVTGIAEQANSWYATGVYAGLGTTLPSSISGDQAFYADGGNLGHAGIFMNGRVGIGTTSPTSTRLHVFDNSMGVVRVANFQNNNSTGTEVQFGSIEYIRDYNNTTDFANPVGILLSADASYDLHLANNSAAKPTSASWTIISDARLKEDIHPFKDGLNVLRKINPVYFKYNGKGRTPKDEYGIGVLAQEVKEVAPYMVGTFEVVSNEKDLKGNIEEYEKHIEEYYSYNPDALHYITLNAVKELDNKQNKIETVFKNISDFGVATLSAAETYISFNDDFRNYLNASVQPVVTITPIGTPISVSIVSQDTKGFTVRLSETSRPVQINWIAMARVKENVLQVNFDYSSTERKALLDKVKLKNGTIRDKIRLEKENLEKVRAERKKAEKVAMQKTQSIENNTP